MTSYRSAPENVQYMTRVVTVTFGVLGKRPDGTGV